MNNQSKIMNRLFSVLMLLYVGSAALSQRIIAITFIDTDDPKIGNGCAVDQNNFRRFYTRLAKTLDYPVLPLKFSDEDFNVENFDKFEQRINPTNLDIILFYNSCHGVRSPSDAEVFPNIRIQQKLRSVLNKHNVISKLPHKNLFTFIDACNVVRNITSSEVKIYSKVWAPVPIEPISELEKSNCKTLFSKPFDVIITSSQPGVYSITTKEGGSVFTNCFLLSFNYYLRHLNPKLVNITNILKKTYNETKAESLRMYTNKRIPRTSEYREQEAQWRLEMKSDTGVVGFEEVDVSANRFQIVYTAKKLSLLQKLRTKCDYEVVLKIKNDDGQIDEISTVRYYFHETFPQPIVTATDRANDYKYTLLLWGEFVVKADIVLTSGQVLQVSQYLDLK